MHNKNRWVFIIIASWITIFLLGLFWDLPDKLAASGIKNNTELYRYLTAAFVHGSVIHLLANCFAFYFGTIYLSDKINGVFLIVFTVVMSTVANIIYALIFPYSSDFYGGSTIIFTSYGLILAMNLTCKNIDRFTLGTWYGNWSLAYLVISNIWNSKMIFGDLSLIIIHGISFAVGTIFGITYLLLFKQLVDRNLFQCDSSLGKKL